MAAAAQALALRQSGEGVLAVEGGHVAGGAGIHDRVAVIIEGGHGEQAGQLDLRQLVHLSGNLHTGADEHDQLVTDPLEVGDQM